MFEESIHSTGALTSQLLFVSLGLVAQVTMHDIQSNHLFKLHFHLDLKQNEAHI